jgi:hypothetical protein
MNGINFYRRYRAIYDKLIYLVLGIFSPFFVCGIDKGGKRGAFICQKVMKDVNKFDGQRNLQNRWICFICRVLLNFKIPQFYI